MKHIYGTGSCLFHLPIFHILSMAYRLFSGQYLMRKINLFVAISTSRDLLYQLTYRLGLYLRQWNQLKTADLLLIGIGSVQTDISSSQSGRLCFLQTLSVYLCVCGSVCLCVSLFKAYISFTMGRILMKLEGNVGS